MRIKYRSELLINPLLNAIETRREGIGTADLKVPDTERLPCLHDGLAELRNPFAR